MRIRDLRQYIKAISGGIETLDALGTDDEFFLEKMNGSGQEMAGLIISAASFANNAKEQLFYEFVQNAYDANADTLCFYANKNYLVVLNNGEPFYTDLNIFNKDHKKDVRDGQLYNFLAKGKSLKLNNDKKLGKYGQGSKLLYTLLADINNNIETETLLKEAIIERKKGPYLISWHNMSQLDALLINGDEWIPSQTDDIENNLLFAKIVMSYYPVAPGQAPRFFTNEEAHDAIIAFNTLVDPKRNKSFLTQGTALIIPLGNGKYDSIIADSNLENVRARLGAFASITASQYENYGKKLRHIYVIKEVVEQHDVQSVFVEFEEGGKINEYHFAFNPVFSGKNVVNFFKGLPILQTKYRFGFILDSQLLEVDDSRQRINDIEKTCEQLKIAFEHLVKKLNIIKENDREKFNLIYKAIISSRPSSNSDEDQKIRDVFYNAFRPFLDKNALTRDGKYVPFEKVCIEQKKIGVRLDTLGISDLHWIDDECKNDYERQFTKKLRVYGFAEMLNDSEIFNLQKWIKSLTRSEYKLFHQYCLESKNEILNIKVFYSNRSNLYSWNELQDTINVFYLSDSADIVFAGQEYIIESMMKDYKNADYQILYNKVESNILTLRSTSIGKNTACEILSLIVSNVPSLSVKVKTEIAVLQNWKDQYLPFCDLMAERPDGTILFDNYRVRGAIPKCVLDKDWLIDKQKEKDALWSWVYRHVDSFKKENGWGVDTRRYIADIKKIYDCASELKTGNTLHLYLDNDGRPVDTECQTVVGFDKLCQEEYKMLTNFFVDYSFVPYTYKKELTALPFSLSCLNVNDFVGDNGITVDYEILKIFIKISERFLWDYGVIEKGDLFLVFQLKGGKNYFNDLAEELKQALIQEGFYYVPAKVQLFFKTDSTTFNITRNDFIKLLISRFVDLFQIFPILKNCSNDALSEYFEKLPAIKIDSKLNDFDNKWQLIKLAVSRNSEGYNFKQTIFEKIQHKNEYLPEKIRVNTLLWENKEYNLYKLSSDYEVANGLIDSFLKCVPSETDVDWFKQSFYNEKIEPVDARELYDILKVKSLSLEQLRFCLDYSLNGGQPNCNELCTNDDISFANVMNMVHENSFNGFDRFYKIEQFNSDIQVFAPNELLVKDEIMPSELYAWLVAHPERIILFSNIRTTSDPYIALRQSIIADTEILVVPEFAIDDMKASNTLLWIINKNLQYIYNSSRYNTIFKVIEKIPENSSQKFFLRYTGNVVADESKIKPVFLLEHFCNIGSFLSSYSWKYGFSEMLKDNIEVVQFFKDNIVYVYNEVELLNKHNLHKSPKIEFKVKANDGDYFELTSSAYKKWRQLPESKEIQIMTSKKTIGMSFAIIKGKDEVLSIGIDNKDYGYEENKLVVVKYPNENSLSPLKVIEQNISDMKFFQEPFIVLQGLYVEELEQLQKQAEEKGVELSLIIQNETSSVNIGVGTNVSLISSNSSECQNTNLSVDDEKLASVIDIVEHFDADELQEIADKKDKLLEVLHDIEAVEDETKESKVRMTIGYIGELIYEQYLIAQSKKYEYAAIKGIGEYDFHNETDKTYVDVKTTLCSLKDGTAPFYLHKSQNVFMQQHPDEKYRIIRISLNDLNLQRSYERIRDIYGKESNPLEDVRLENECKKIADKYWRGAMIEEFDALSPEYAIRIEEKNKK